MRWVRAGLVAAVIVASACTHRPDAKPVPQQRPPDAGCAETVQPELDPGLETRTVVAGPVSLVTFRVSAVPEGAPPAQNFKLAVRLDAGADATLRTRTAGTTLLFDRAALLPDNTFRLDAARKSIRLTGCPDRSAVFVGAVLSTGPTTLHVDVRAHGHRKRVTLSAFTG